METIRLGLRRGAALSGVRPRTSAVESERGISALSAGA